MGVDSLWALCHDCEVRAFQMLGGFVDGNVSRNRRTLENMCAHLMEAKVPLGSFLVFFISKLQKQSLWSPPCLLREDLVLRKHLQGA